MNTERRDTLRYERKHNRNNRISLKIFSEKSAERTEDKKYFLNLSKKESGYDGNKMLKMTKQIVRAGVSGIFAASLILNCFPSYEESISRLDSKRDSVLSSSEIKSQKNRILRSKWNNHWIANAKGVKRIKNGPIVTLPSGVQYQEMSIGEGASPQLGDRVAVHYSLFCNGFEVESTRDSSGLAARPYGFNWGSDNGFGSFPKAVQEGMKGMQIGGRRKITVPAKLAYGEKGRPPFIPPNSDVLFDISIWSIKPAGINPNLTLSGQQNYF